MTMHRAWGLYQDRSGARYIYETRVPQGPFPWRLVVHVGAVDPELVNYIIAEHNKLATEAFKLQEAVNQNRTAGQVQEREEIEAAARERTDIVQRLMDRDEREAKTYDDETEWKSDPLKPARGFLWAVVIVATGILLGLAFGWHHG